MISFCVLEEFLGLLSNSYGRTVSNGIPSIHDSKNLEDYKQNLLNHKQNLLSTFAQTKGGDNQMSGPSDSAWSWVPFSHERTGQNQINQIDTTLRKLKNEPELYKTWKDGAPAPEFGIDNDNNLGHAMNFAADHPVGLTLGAGALATAAYLGKKWWDKRQQQKQQTNQGLSSFSNSAAGRY